MISTLEEEKDRIGTYLSSEKIGVLSGEVVSQEINDSVEEAGDRGTSRREEWEGEEREGDEFAVELQGG